jgi:4a-hydroxytetrahydrobiopterin dehydratase
MATHAAEDLKQKHCKPCEGGVKPLSREESEKLLAEVTDWKLIHGNKAIRREWVMQDFGAAMEFFEHVAVIAEAEKHHPDLHLTGYRNVAIEVSTHAIGGLSENDFILAAKINDIPVKLKGR